MIRQLSICIALLLLLSMPLCAQSKALKKIKKEVQAATNSKEFSTGFIGFCLMDAESGKVLLESNSEKSFVTASTMKPVTLGAALALLGDTFRFKTELAYTGEIKDSILWGDIYIIGGADPTTGSDRWDETYMPDIIIKFGDAIKKLGIKKVYGGVVAYPDKYLDGNIPPGFDVGDLNTRYGAPPYGLNYAENYIDRVDTIILNPHIMEETTMVKKYSPYNSNGIPNPESPPLEFASALTESLENLLRIEVLNYARVGSVENVKHIITYYSLPLKEIATETNQKSINLFAECILRATGIQQYGYSNLDTCLYLSQKFWKAETGNLKGFRQTDGSGLSRSNLCTPQLFCQMLSAYYKRPNFQSFYSTFAVAGQSGTVENFCKNTPADGNAHIKTGTMSRVKNFIGYVTGANGRMYTFALLFNNFEPTASPTDVARKIVPMIAQLKEGKMIKIK